MEKERVLFAGDTLFQMSYGRIDFPTGSGRAMETSVRRLLAELPDDVTVYPGHMDQTTIAFERTYNPLAEK
jgi:hydroxyacylglutathione hydrolase